MMRRAPESLASDPVHDPLAFLFPDLDLDEWDLEEEGDRAELIEIAFPQFEGVVATSALIVANQIIDGEPPVTWATAQRMLDAGLDRGDVMRQLVTVMLVVVRSLVQEERPFEDDEYESMLAALPMPTTVDIADRVVAVVDAQPGITMDDAVAAALGEVPDDDVFAVHLDSVWDRLLVGGPLEILSGERLIRLGAGAATRTFTHRLTDEDVASSCVHDSFDLGALADTGTLHLVDGRPVDVDRERGVDLHGPDGWFDLPAGTLLAFRVEDGVLHVDPLDDEPSLDLGLVERFRAAYDRAQAVLALPSRASDVVAELLVDDPTAFDTPQRPLSDVAEAAGLEVRGGVAAHDDDLWIADNRAARNQRAFEDLGGRAEAEAALRVLDVADAVAIAGRDDLLSALDDLTGDPEVLLFVANELFGTDELAEQHGHDLSAALLSVATRSGQQAAARWLAAISAERAGDPTLGEAHLEAGHEADPTDPRLIDRLAWYASDRGDADRALRLWRRLEPTRVIADDIAVLVSVTGGAADASKTPRNAPCWCGSGRKYKQCHLGKPAELDLAARVPWLLRKATGYLFRRGGSVQSDLFDVALALAGVGDDDIEELDHEAILAAMTDPIVFDLLLVEEGWFRRFVDERATLLPADEAELAASWVDVPHSVYEVTAVAGSTATVRDLRGGDEIEVRRPPSARAGVHLLGRVVPDGVGRAFLGAVVVVADDHAGDLLAALDSGRSLVVARAVAAMAGR